MECMELMMVEQPEERVFEKDFVPDFLFFFIFCGPILSPQQKTT